MNAIKATQNQFVSNVTEATKVGTEKTWGGVKYKKAAEGPDNVKENWEKVE